MRGSNMTWRGDEFLKDLDRRIASSLSSLKFFLDPEIDAATPYDTGALRASRQSQVDGDTLVYIYELYYAAYVFFGTYKMYPQPWITEVVMRLSRRITEIIVRGLTL